MPTSIHVHPISKFVQFIPGFMQNRAKTNFGLPLLAREFFIRYDEKGLAKVEFEEWYTDWEAQAEWIRRLSFGCDPTIMVISYSWGVGFGTVQFANALRDRGLKITHLVASDGVYHLGGKWCHNIGVSQAIAYWPYLDCTERVTKRLNILGRPKIRVPDNVQNVDWFVQSNSRCGHRLRGHDLVDQRGEPIGTRHDIRFRIHSAMDECPEFWECCREVADGLFLGPNNGE